MSIMQPLMDVAMPERIQKLPMDHRGFPILYMTPVDAMGVPNFRGCDEAKRRLAAHYRLCCICGEKLGWWVRFVGGPENCTRRIFSDPPMHQECLDYGMAVCPFLLRSSEWLEMTKAAELRGEIPETGPVRFPDKWGIYITRSYTLVKAGPTFLFKAAPAKEIRWCEMGPTGSAQGGT